MKIFYNNVFKNYLLLMITLFIGEIIFRGCVGLPIISLNILKIFVGLNLVSLLVSLLSSFLGRLASNIICGLVAMLSTIYSIAQVGFYKYIGLFISFNNFKQIGAVIDYIGEYISAIPFTAWLISVPLIILVLYYIFADNKLALLERNDIIDFSDKFDSEERKKINDEKIIKLSKRKKINTIINGVVFTIVFLGVYIFLNSSFMQNNLQIKSSKELFNNPDMPNLAVNNLGTFMYSIADIKSSMFPSSIKAIGTEYDSGYKKQEQVISDYTRYVDDTLWVQAANNERNSKYKKINNYLLSQEITDKNDYTGSLKGKNLILIEMSSVNNMVINKEYFPNIYKLYSEGWSFDNSYSPNNICAGGNNEISALTGLYMLNNSCVSNNYKNNTYTESLFNLFNNAGYNTTSFHNYTNQYYNRSVVHTNMGSSYYYGVEELGIPYSNVYTEWPSDISLMEKVLEINQNKDKFMTFVSTTSTLHPYDSSSELGDKYLDLFNDTNYNIALKRYMSKLKELDNAIGTLVEGLEAQGKLDETVIVLYSDHAPYGLSEKDLNSYFDYDVSINSEKDRTPFIIYNSKMESDKHNEYTSYVNITPTIANLFDLDYDPRLYVGKDILSKNYDNRLIMADGSWQDEKAYYNATTNKLTYYRPNNEYKDDELSQINKSIRDRILISNLAIRTNYFNYLDTKKDEYRVAQVDTQSN